MSFASTPTGLRCGQCALCARWRDDGDTPWRHADASGASLIVLLFPSPGYTAMLGGGRVPLSNSQCNLNLAVFLLNPYTCHSTYFTAALGAYTLRSLRSMTAKFVEDITLSCPAIPEVSGLSMLPAWRVLNLNTAQVQCAV